MFNGDCREYLLRGGALYFRALSTHNHRTPALVMATLFGDWRCRASEVVEKK